MFTGIVDHCGHITHIKKTRHNYAITISSNFQDLCLGESIAIDGACLTVVSFDKSEFTVQVSPETMRLTIASQYEVGIAVNLERSLRLTDRLGGHFVTGHIDGLCQIGAINANDQFIEIVCSHVVPHCMPYLIKKGSVAINGVSLTLNEITDDGFAVMLIPHTLERTNLSGLKQGNNVNVEYDYLAKIVHKQMQGEKV
jgi:riboflavin synthase